MATVQVFASTGAVGPLWPASIFPAANTPMPSNKAKVTDAAAIRFDTFIALLFRDHPRRGNSDKSYSISWKRLSPKMLIKLLNKGPAVPLAIGHLGQPKPFRQRPSIPLVFFCGSPRAFSQYQISSIP